MQALYAVYRKQACRHQGRDTMRRSNLNDIFTCRGTESFQTPLPAALSCSLLHISTPSCDMLIIARGKTLLLLACKTQRFIFQVTCAAVHGLRCKAAGETRAQTGVIRDEILKWGNVTWELRYSIKVCESFV